MTADQQCKTEGCVEEGVGGAGGGFSGLSGHGAAEGGRRELGLRGEIWARVCSDSDSSLCALMPMGTGRGVLVLPLS